MGRLLTSRTERVSGQAAPNAGGETLPGSVRVPPYVKPRRGACQQESVGRCAFFAAVAAAGEKPRANPRAAIRGGLGGGGRVVSRPQAGPSPGRSQPAPA